MQHAGGLVIVHADIGQAVTRQLPGTNNYQTFIMPSQYENFRNIMDVFQRNPRQQFIWAHAGASYTQQTDPTQHLALLRELLTTVPNVKIDLSWTATNRAIFRDGRAWARLVAEFPTRFIWGSDTIAASLSLDPEAIKGPMKALERNGFLRELDEIAPGLKERFLSQNFLDTLPPAQQRVNEWRSHPEVARWLEVGGYENGTAPPMVWVKQGNNWDDPSDWRLVANPDYVRTDPLAGSGTGLAPAETPGAIEPATPVAFEPYVPPVQAPPTTGQLAGRAINQLVRPQGLFFGGSTHLGSGFAVIPRRAFTQFFNPSELANLRRGGFEALSLRTFYGSTTLQRWDIAPGTAVTAQLAGIANRSTQEAGVNVFVSQTLPGEAGKIGFFFNIRQDWATAQPLIERFVRSINRQSESGVNPVLAEFANGQLPDELNSISGNFGLMYGVSDPLIAAVAAANPALGGALKAAQEATGGEIWIGGGGRADLNFYNGDLVSIRLQDTMLPIDGVRNLLQNVESARQSFIAGLQDSARVLVEAQQRETLTGGSASLPPVGPSVDLTPAQWRILQSVGDSVGGWLSGASPWESVQQKLDIDPTTGAPLIEDGTVSFLPSLRPAENIAAQVYTLAVRYRVLQPDEAITRDRAGSVVDAILDAAREESAEAYERTIGQLTSNGYNINFGSRQLQDYYAQPGNYDLGYLRGIPRDYDAVRRQLSP